MSRLAGVRAAIAMAVVGSLTSCKNPAQVVVVAANVGGGWNYFAATTSAPTTLSGTLTISQSGTPSFTGALEGTEYTGGQMRRVIGLVSGRTIDSARFDFDLALDAATRRHHVGSIRGDSISGTWLETTSTGIAASGTFRGSRSTQQ
jgi:hypothetical protein